MQNVSDAKNLFPQSSYISNPVILSGFSFVSFSSFVLRIFPPVISQSSVRMCSRTFCFRFVSSDFALQLPSFFTASFLASRLISIRLAMGPTTKREK